MWKTTAAVAVALLLVTPEAGQAQGVKAVLTDSWGTVSDHNLVYSALNAHWSNYGTVPLQIVDYGSGPVTLAGLQASGADVVIVSDPAGRPDEYEWSASEIAALQEYASQGHNLLGSFLLLQWADAGIDDRLLAPLWGLRSDLTYDHGGMMGLSYQVMGLQSSLFRGIANPYASSGFPYSMQPVDDHRWDAADLAGASIVGATSNYGAVVTSYNAGSYVATFISSMPEYQGSAVDERFIYNAIVNPIPEPATMGLLAFGLAALAARRRT